MTTEQSYLTVTALTKYVARKFSADPHLTKLLVRGELSNITFHSSGHIYCTLKDQGAQIRAVMFARQAQHVQFRLEEGMQVLIEGSVQVYERMGQYQLYIERIEPDGVGSLYLKFEQLKRDLAKEGLFEERWKMPLPPYPKKIAIVTAKTGAAIRDMYTTIQRRYPLVELTLYESLVQGEKAAPSIVRAIERANEGEYDVLIVGRGGGSIEDLWAFNEEQVARAIFESRIPVISAVGHETDTTIADFVADLRAPTPTAAAELAVPSQLELQERVKQQQWSLTQLLRYQLERAKKRYEYAVQSPVFQRVERLYEPQIERHLHAERALQQAMRNALTEKERQLWNVTHALSSQTPKHKLIEARHLHTSVAERLQRAIATQQEQKQEQLLHQIRLLQTLNPLSILERGFSVTYEEENVVTTIEQLTIDHEVKIQLKDGVAKAVVTDVQKEEL